MTRVSFKTTSKAKAVMLAVAELNDQDIADLIHNYFYLLAKTMLDEMDNEYYGGDELLGIFNEAMRRA